MVESRLTLNAVNAAMAHLAAEQRMLIALVCIDGLSYKEAAEITDTPIGTVMSRLARARRELHARLEGHSLPTGAEPPTAQTGEQRMTLEEMLAEARITEMEIMRYADGVLAPERRPIVRAALAKYPELMQLLESFLFTRGPLVDAYDEVLDAPIPARILNLLQPRPSVRPPFSIGSIPRAGPASGSARPCLQSPRWLRSLCLAG